MHAKYHTLNSNNVLIISIISQADILMSQSRVSQSTTMKLEVRDLKFWHRCCSRLKYSGMYIYVVGSVASDGSKDNSAFISRIKQSKKGWALLGIFDPVPEGSTTIRNVVNYTPHNTSIFINCSIIIYRINVMTVPWHFRPARAHLNIVFVIEYRKLRAKRRRTFGL
jgi:hypothetical protein